MVCFCCFAPVHQQLYHRIIDIAFHAKSGAILCQFHDENIGKGLDMTLRGCLKGTVQKIAVKRVMKLKEFEKK